MQQTVKWLPKPENHGYQAAEDYLSLIMSPKNAADYRQQLSAADLLKVSSSQSLSPILLLRGNDKHPLIVADGYHRVCASYWIDENTDIPCILI